MMPYIYLLSAMCASAMLSIMSSLFGRKNAGTKDTSSLYSLIVTISATVSWGILFLWDGEFCGGVLAYSLVYGVFYTMAMVGMFKAYQVGSVPLTAFVKQLSLIGVAFWGLIFWDTPITVNVTIGLVLIVAALYLCFKPDKKAEGKTFTLKWLLYASMLLVGNAGCSIIQKYQQMAFGGKYGSQLMFFGAICSAAACAVMYLKGSRCKLKELAKGSVFCPVAGGISSAALNLFILLMLSTTLSESVIFPGIAVGGFMLTTAFSVIVYRERLRKEQWVGLAIGAVALVFLNL